jgi:uncharacterized membrane protein YccC
LAVRDWIDRLAASDPGHAHWRTGVWALLTAGLGAGLLLLAGQALHLPSKVALIGAVAGLMTTVAVQDATREAQQVTLAWVALLVAVVLVAGTAVAGHPLLSAGGFVAVVAAALELRRFGARGAALGTMAAQTWFYTLLLQPELAHAAWLALSVAAGCAIAWVVRFRLWPERPQRVLESELQALRARIALLLGQLARSLREPRRREPRHALRERIGPLNALSLRIEQRLTRFAADDAAARGSLDALRDGVLRAEIAAEALATCTAAATHPGHGPAAARPQLAAALLRLRERVRGGAGRDAGALRAGAGADEGLDADLRWRFERAARVLAHDPPWELPLPPLRDSTVPGAPPARQQHAGPRGAARLLQDEPTRLALQAALAALGAALVGGWISPEHWYWAVFGAYVVFTRATTRGQALAGAWIRILGNVAGLALGLGLAELAHGSPALQVGLLFAFVGIGFYLFQALPPAYTALLTAMLAMLYELLGKYSPGLLALRLEETMAGAVIAVLCAAVVAPVHTTDQSDQECAALLRAAATLLRTAFAGPAAPPTRDAVRDLDARLQALRQALAPVTRPGVPAHKSGHRERLQDLSLLVYCMRHFYDLCVEEAGGLAQDRTLAQRAGLVADNMEQVAQALGADAEASKPPALREWPPGGEAERAPADGPVQSARIAMHWLAEANAVLQALAAPNRNESIASAP